MSTEAPDCPIDLPPQLTYEQSLRYTQGLRKAMSDKLIGGEHGLPTDKDGVELLLKVLKDMDHTSLTDRKNKIDQEGVNTSKEVADTMALYVKQNPNQNLFYRAPDGSAVESQPQAAIPHVDPQRLGVHEAVEGETEVGIIAETADQFFARMAQEKKEEE